jgi:hypothetical protein
VIETVVYEVATLVPEPIAVFDAGGGAHAPPMALPLGVDGLVPVATGASVKLGQFVGEALSVALLHRAANARLGLIGAPLTHVQMEAMTSLDLLGSYIPIDAPTVVSRLHVTRGLGLGLSRFIRPAIESLRFAAEPFEVSRRIAILGAQQLARFSRANHGSLQIWLRAQSFAALDLGAMKLGAARLRLTDLIAALAAARVVVIDDPAQAALLGFCDPGAVVLELGIDGWHDSAIMEAARLFGLEWRLVVAAAPHYPVKTALPLGARRMLRTEVDIGALDRALSSIDPGTDGAIS